MSNLPPADQEALLFPIQAKGAVTRLSPLGDPSIAQFYQKSLEQGRILESSIADANNWLLQKKQLLTNYIQSYTHMNQLAVDGQLGHTPRVPKYIADGIAILKTAQQLQQEIVGLIAAIEQNITTLLAIEASMLQMVQTTLNSIANLLNNICNWGLPSLPSIPNLFPDTMWNWNGFQFSPLALFAALKSNTNFNFNFTFANCSLGSTAPAGTLTSPNPNTTTTYSGLTYGAQNNYQPPLNGQPSPVGQDLSDPAYISQMQGTTTPVYGPSFNPNTSMFGAVPDPHTIISNYQMPATTYTSSIVSICPQLRSNTVFVTDSDYSNPNYTVRDATLRQSLVHFITLQDIVSANYDPYLLSAWLIYMNISREGRGGVWIPNFQAVYDTYLQPSITALNVNPVSWNDVLGQTNFFWMGNWGSTVSYAVNDVVVFNGINYIALVANTGSEPDTNPTDWGTPPAGTIYSDAPVIALASTLQSLSPNQLNHTLWQLSYIEAGILGYTRNSQWDTDQDSNYLTGPTGSDLDYKPIALTAQQNSLVLGEGTAQFPVPITFPSVMKTSLDAVIATATISILNDLTYLSSRLGNRFTYNQFGIATMVDRFSQFWRDFSTNLTAFLAQDPYLVQFAITYPDILDGAIDPLASAANLASYQSLMQDIATRNRNWTPGTPLLTIPIQPIVAPTNSSSPTVNSNGWISPSELDPAAFLSRPDIQALPIPVQIAMLRTNLSYAGINTWSNNMQSEIANQLATANSLLQNAQSPGFHVSIYTTTTLVSPVQFGAITNIAVSSNILTVAVTTMPAAFTSGTSVTFYGLGGATFLNGQTLTVLPGATTTSFTANFTNPNYTSTPDTGIALVSTWTSSATDVAFDPLQSPQDYDYTNNYTNPTTFTIQTAGSYLGFAVINWTLTAADTVAIVVTQNGVPISVANVQGGPGSLTTQVSFNGTFSQGDIVKVIAFTSSSTEDVVAGNPNSEFSMFAV